MPEIARTVRPFYIASNKEGVGPAFVEKEIEFDWHKGISWQVRQRSSIAMTKAIESAYPELVGKILEVSTKSVNHELGAALSAMNLLYTDLATDKTYPVENWFQSSKQYTKDGKIYGPYTELLDMDPVSAKRYVNASLSPHTALQYKHDAIFNHIQSDIKDAQLTGFIFLEETYRTEPKSAFYDYIYSKALKQNRDLADAINKYNVFTDIEFNPVIKGKIARFNTQARSCAIYVALKTKGLIDIALEDYDSFLDCVQYETKKINETEMEEQLELRI